MGRKGQEPRIIAEAVRKVADDGVPVAEICARYGITERTFYRWKLKSTNGSLAEDQLLQQIEEENLRLKTLVADLILENRALKAQLPGRKNTNPVPPRVGRGPALAI